MDRRLLYQLHADTEALRDLISTASTEAVVGMISAYNTTRYVAEKPVADFISPGKQPFFLIRLLQTTPEPAKPKPFGHKEWERSVELLNSIFNLYSLMFWPTSEERENLPERWYRIREVAMPAFLHYFNTGILASVEQVSNRIRLYLSPFDDVLDVAIGISASNALRVTDWLSKTLQDSSDRLQEAADQMEKDRQEVLSRASDEHWTDKRLHHEIKQNKTYRSNANSLASLMQKFLKLYRTDSETQFGPELATAFWQLFVSRRGQITEATYITERNPVEERPLVEIAPDIAMIPLVNQIYNAIFIVGERALLSSAVKENYLKRRDKTLEKESERLFGRLFGTSASYYPEVYETSTLDYEHDLVMIWKRKLFVVEAKATAPAEPFRDPEKAFTRIYRAFHSSKGLQKAFEQGNRIRKQLNSGNEVKLYNDERQQVVTIKPEDIDEVFLVCLTRDDFGALAADLSLLLKKGEDDPYPWAVNILDLENIIDAWDYFGWPPDRLCEYLNERCKLQGKIFVTDELDVVGFFIRHGGLHWLTEAEADRLFITPDYAHIFDEIYFAREGGKKVLYSPKPPVLNDMREMIGTQIRTREQLLSSLPARIARRQGRNEKCLCGSGKKFKNCCEGII